MIAYWLIFIIPLIAILHPVRLDNKARGLALWLFALLLVIIIGFRHEVGGDWGRYLYVYDYILDAGGFWKNSRSDIGYEFFNWLSKEYFNSIYLANLLSATIFVSGLLYFCKRILMPWPWIGLIVSIPFLFLVVSMGYTRQSVAVGLLMFALVELSKGYRYRYYTLIIIGTLFHKTLVIMLLVGVLYRKKRGVVFWILWGFISILLFYFMVENYFSHMVYYYITTKYHSSGGAFIRVLMSSFAGFIFFVYRQKMKELYYDVDLWFIFSVVSIVLLPMSFFYSTFTDRVAVYFLPLQLVIFSRVPALITSSYNRTVFVTGTIFLYAATMFVWLFYGTHSYLWLPYNNIIVGG